MVSKIVSILNQPFPSSNAFSAQVTKSLGVGIFVFLFLFLLRPFGSHQVSTYDAFLHSLGFGCLTFFVSLVYDMILQRLLRVEFDKPTWTFWKWIICTLVLIVLISIANFFFMTHVLGYVTFAWTNFFFQLYATMLVGIFPLIFFGTVNLMSSQKKYHDVARQLQVQNKTVSTKELIAIQSEQGTTDIDLSTLLYIESLQNYVVLHFEQQPSITIRATLKSLEDQLSPWGMIRSHRSYLVNPNKVESVNGNAQGLKLLMAGVADIVPVSRKYISAIKQVL